MNTKAKVRENKVLGVPMPPDLRERFKAQAALEGRSLASLARFAIEYYLKAKQRPRHEQDAPVRREEQ